MIAFNHRKKMTPAERQAAQQEALTRAKENLSEGNYQTIFSEFSSRGIPEAEIKPRENVFTYLAWQAQGRQVRKGEHGVRISTVIHCERKETDPETKEEKKIPCRTERRASVFHISQTDPIEGGPAAAGNPPPAKSENTSGAKSGVNAAILERARLWRDKADAMQGEIDKKLDPAIGRQNPTRRRMSIAQSMREDAYKLQEVQQAFRQMALAAENSAAGMPSEPMPYKLLEVRSRQSLYEILMYHRDEDEDARAWLKNRIAGKTEEQERAERIKALERDIWSYKIDGFFPTPKSLVDDMLEAADVQPGQSVLEPSAGKGDIAEAVRAQGEAGQLELIEVNSTLCKLLNEKGFQPHNVDFLKMAGDGFDRILMNPPFENGQDIEHVQHAYDLLAPGGRLVAIMCEGPFYRTDRKSEDFRTWINSRKYYARKLPAGTFTGPEAFKQTGVACRMVVINK